MNHANLQFVYRDVPIERIDEIRPLWEELNAYHLQWRRDCVDHSIATH
jgi:hypothetical protein